MKVSIIFFTWCLQMALLWYLLEEIIKVLELFICYREINRIETSLLGWRAKRK